MVELFETAAGLAEHGRTMLGGIPRPLDLALFTQEFEDEVQGTFPPAGWSTSSSPGGLAREAPPSPAVRE